MADQVQTPGSGGGEGVPAEAKPETAVEPPKAEALTEVKPEESKQAEPQPTEVQPEQPTAQTELTKEVKAEEPKEVKAEEPKEVKTEEPKEVKAEEPKEVKAEEPKEVKAEEPKEVKPEQPKDETVAPIPETKVEATQEESKPTNGVAESSAGSKDQGDWQQRESELLKRIDDLEKVKKERKQDSYLLELKVREEEIDLLKARVKNLETELQAALSKPTGKNHEMIENIKQQHEELLSKARGMIFDKTKMVKNQELQIEALNSQIQSLKDINQITKDLLEIRNSEIKAMEDRLHAMEARFKAEKERYGLVLQRAQTSSNINDDLRKEYETQLVLFKELREKYDQRVQALVAENERLKASLAPPAGAGTSG